MLQRLSIGFLAFVLLTGCSGSKLPPVNQTKAPPTVETPGPPTTTPPPVAPVRVPDRRGLLLDLNRIDLAICIQVAGETEVDPAVVQKTVRTALKGLASKASWERLGYDLLQNRVEVGCPSGPHLLKPGVTRQGGLVSIPVPFVEKSSPYLVFLFVLPKADVDRIFADVFDRTSFQEVLREGDSPRPVSTGLYLTPSDIDQERIEWGLSEALHL
jgi:hypothetical protein